MSVVAAWTTQTGSQVHLDMEGPLHLQFLLEPMLFVRAGPALHGPALHGRLQSPECLPLHVLLCNAMILQRLVPHRVPGVAQGLRTKLVGLEPQERDRQTGTCQQSRPGVPPLTPP